MKIKVRTLQHLLNTSKPNLPGNCVIPILHNYLFKATDNTLQVVTTNLTSLFTIQTKDIQQENNERFQFVISDTFRELVSLLKDEELLEIQVLPGEQKIKALTEKGEFIFSVLKPEEFPDTVIEPGENEKAELIIGASTLANKIQDVYFASSKEDITNFCNVMFDLTEEGLTLVATDAYVLAKNNPKVNNKSAGKQIIGLLDREIALKFKTILSLLVGDLILTLSSSYLSIKNDSIFFETKLLDRKPANYKAILPKNYTKKITFDKSELTACLKRINQINEMDGTHKTILTVDAKGKVVIHNYDKSSREILKKAVPEGFEEEFEIGLNTKRMIQGITMQSAEKLTIHFDNPNKPICFEAEFYYLQMPTKI